MEQLFQLLQNLLSRDTWRMLCHQACKAASIVARLVRAMSKLLTPSRSRSAAAPGPGTRVGTTSHHDFPEALPITGVREVPPTQIVFTPPKHFDQPHERSAPIQAKTAMQLLGLIGVECLPGITRARLEEVDAFYAVRMLTNELGHRYAELLASDEARTRFKVKIALLLNAEDLHRESGLNLTDFIRSLRSADGAAIESMIQRMKMVAQIKDLLAGHDFIIPGVVETFSELLHRWTELTDTEVTEIHEQAYGWITFQQLYDEKTHKITWLIDALADHAQASDDLHEVWARDVERFEKAKTEIAEGKFDPNTALKILDMIHDRLADLYEPFAEQTGAHTAGGDDPLDNIRRALECLGLRYPDDLDIDKVKRAYWKLAKTCHPEGDSISLGREEADLRFYEITEARDILKHHLFHSTV